MGEIAKSFFVTGTNTEVGKTYVAAQLIKAYREKEAIVSGFKPVASGGQWRDGLLVNEDALGLIEHANVSLPYDVVNPYCFEPAIAPHIAAYRTGVKIDESVIQSAFAQHVSKSDVVIIEGAGGWKVPLNDNVGFDDVALNLGAPVILVVGLTLGCINHALLTEEAILNKGCRLVGWVGNALQADFQETDETVEALKARLKSPCLCVFDYALDKDKTSLVKQRNIARLLDYLAVFR
jgi:dethiobiotin synthetase